MKYLIGVSIILTVIGLIVLAENELDYLHTKHDCNKIECVYAR